MTDDPDELRYQIERSKRDPAEFKLVLDEIFRDLRYEIRPSIKLFGWLIVILLSLILWRVW
jgi:hypothetical protein